MPYNKEELMALSPDEKKELVSELIDSMLVDEAEPLSEWKKELIKERIQYHNENPGNGTNWNELKKEYQFINHYNKSTFFP